VEGRDGAQYPAGGEDCAATSHPECYAPELVAAGFGELVLL
jgi:hypothetical protein